MLSILPSAANPAWAQSGVTVFPAPTSGVVLPTVTPSPTRPPATQSGGAALDYVPGQLLVGMRKDAQQAVASGLNSALGGSAPDMVGQVAVMQSMDLSTPEQDIVVNLLSVPAGREYDVALLIASQPGVVFVEPNGYVYAAGDAPDVTVPEPYGVNDPLYGQQWHHQRIGMVRAWQMALDPLQFDNQGADVIVSIIDSGIDTTHPEFAGRIISNVTYKPGEVTPVDDCGHGTHIAALAAAALNNSIGGAGSAPNVRIDVRRALYAAGGGCTGSFAGLAQAIKDSTDDAFAAGAAHVINMSLETSTNSPTLLNAIIYAAAKDSLMVAAAGNGGLASISFPARYPQVVTVGALTVDDTKAIYSNTGPEMAIAAPGGQGSAIIRSAWSKDALGRCSAPPILPGTPGPHYCGQAGTSQATGIVSGVAALLFSLGPTQSAADVRALLSQSATPLGLPAEQVGAGKLNAEQAVRLLLPPSLIAATPIISETVPSTTTAIYTRTIRLDNPSLEPLTVSATLEDLPELLAAGVVTGTEGLTLTVASDNPYTQTFYGAPLFLNLTIDPAKVGTLQQAQLLLEISGAVTDTKTIPVNVGTEPPPPPGFTIFLPAVRNKTATASDVAPLAPPVSTEATAYTWLKPALPAQRTIYAMTGVTNVVVSSLPSTVTVGTQSFNALRIYADGFIAFPVTAPFTATYPTQPGLNGCLPSLPVTVYPQQAVYGWWADLEADAPGATVSTFSTGGRFVVEYDNVPAASATEAYTVSFQIVLDGTGAVQLNYKETPDFIGWPEPVTVGVETVAGRFHSQVACATEDNVFGVLPQDETTFRIAARNIF